MNTLTRYKVAAALLLLTLAVNANAQIGKWTSYLSYSDITDVQKGGNMVYVLASGNLFSYNEDDTSVTTYSKSDVLNDNGIMFIKWCRQAQCLVIVYENQNIDLLKNDGTSMNISDLYSKTMTGDKTVFNIYMNGECAYLATGFGIVKINVRRAEISDSYILGFSVNNVFIKGSNIYASSMADGLYEASLSSNLQDKANWKRVGDFVADSYTPDAALMEKAERFKPNSTACNSHHNIVSCNGTLYTVPGRFVPGEPDYNTPGTVCSMNGDETWTAYEDNIDKITGYDYLDNNCIAIDPNDNKHALVGGRCGLYEFQDGKLVKAYNQQNSPLQGACDRGNMLGNNYTIVNGITYDKDGNAWILNSLTQNSNIIEIKKDGTCVSHFKNELLCGQVGMANLTCPFFDSRGLLWFVNNHYTRAALICYNTENESVKVYDKFVNQDGNEVDAMQVRCAVEDGDGNIWIGTDKGPMVISTEEIRRDGDIFIQPKVPRNDGTNLADYLLLGIDVSSISIDGGGRLWMATNGQGVYLIDSDGVTQLQHFTKSNSQLIDDNIESTCIDGKSGRVFFATLHGLCSYVNDATTPAESMQKDSVWAYPNPVTPNYTGLVTVTGLTANADIKILSAAGNVVAAGHSNGGTFTWDCNDKNGRRVASGVYFVHTATAEGKKGVVCRIAVVN